MSSDKQERKLIQRSIVVDENQWRKARVKSAEMDVNISQVVRLLVAAWLNDEIKIEKPVRR